MKGLPFRIVFLKGSITELDFKIDRFVDYCKESEVDHYVADINDLSCFSSDAFNSFISRDDCAMFTYNDLGMDIRIGGDNIWKKNGVPVFTFLVDHPRNYDDALMQPGCDIYVICCDRNHVDFVKEYYPLVKDAFFFAQAGAQFHEYKPSAEKTIDVFYMGSCKRKNVDYPIVPEIENCAQDFYSYCISELFADPLKTTEEVIDSFFRVRGIPITKEQRFNLYRIVAIYIETTVRREFALSAMHALDRAGVHVVVYGGKERWVEADNPYSENIDVRERVPVQELLEEIGKAKISLCFIPWFKRGASEKNFDALINGTLCVTDESEYLKERYIDGENIIYFDLRNPDQMAADVKWLLEHPDVLDDIAYKGYCIAKEYDSWNVRYKQICEKILDVIRK